MKSLHIFLPGIIVLSMLSFVHAAEPKASKNKASAKASKTKNVTKKGKKMTTAGPVKELVMEDIKVGDGDEATPGKTVSVHYTGWLTDGTKFDSSVDRGKPFNFSLGAGQVIQGWDKGVAGMKVGGKRKLTIPPDMGYGSRGVGPIPANSTLVFDVELLGVQ